MQASELIDLLEQSPEARVVVLARPTGTYVVALDIVAVEVSSEKLIVNLALDLGVGTRLDFTPADDPKPTADDARRLNTEVHGPDFGAVESDMISKGFF